MTHQFCKPCPACREGVGTIRQHICAPRGKAEDCLTSGQGGDFLFPGQTNNKKQSLPKSLFLKDMILITMITGVITRDFTLSSPAGREVSTHHNKRKCQLNLGVGYLDCPAASGSSQPRPSSPDASRRGGTGQEGGGAGGVALGLTRKLRPGQGRRVE